MLFKRQKQPTVFIDLGWGVRTTGGIEIHEIDANHHEIIGEPHVQYISKILAANMDFASRNNELSTSSAPVGTL